MYKVSIWLKGGGKIVEECDIDCNEAKDLLDNVMCALHDGSVYGCLQINRNENDVLPIVVAYSEIAAAQLDENKRVEHHGRKLETRY